MKRELLDNVTSTFLRVGPENPRLTRLRNVGCDSLAEVTPISSHLPYPSNQLPPALPLDEIRDLSKKEQVST